MPSKKTRAVNLHKQGSSVKKYLVLISDIAGTVTCTSLLMSTISEYEGKIPVGNSIVGNNIRSQQ